MAKIFCPLCQSKKIYLVYPANVDKSYFDNSYRISGSAYGKHLNIYRCPRCGFVFEEISPIREKIANYYLRSDDQSYEDERKNRALAFKRIISRIKEFKPSGRLLDVGCATGALLVEARKSGFETYGIESSSWAAKIAQKKYRLDVKRGFFDQTSFPKGYFDVVTLIDVIEHLCEPKLSLLRVNGLLKKGGVICVVTPNIESFMARVFGERWWHIRPGHFFYFSPKTIKLLLKMTGFKIIALRTYKWYLSFSYLLHRLLKLLLVQEKISLDKTEILKKLTVGIDLRDSMEIYATK